MDGINAPKPIRCRAAVTRAGGGPMVIEEVEVAPPKAWEVRIKIICTSLCHSDVTFWMLKDFPGVFPRIFGHEAIGSGRSMEGSSSRGWVYSAIFGLGAVGLAVAEGSRIRGAARIIGVDLNPDKFDIGKKFGITDFINPNDIGERPISEVIKEMTDGGADYCFECIGLSSLMHQAFQSSREGWGKTIILGVQMHGAPLSIMPNEILRGKCVVGSLFGGIKGKVDIPILIKQYLNKELQLDKFISHELGLQDINEAFDLLIKGKSLRCIIWMDR